MNTIFLSKEILNNHINNYIEVQEKMFDAIDALYEDFVLMIKSFDGTEELAKEIWDVVGGMFDSVILMEYMANGDKKSLKDILRQAYMIADAPMEYHPSEYKRAKLSLTKEQIKEFDKLNMPYSIKEIEKESKDGDIETELEMTMADYHFLEKQVKKLKTSHIKKMKKLFEDEYFPIVPEEEVKEIHVYYEDMNEEILFLDEEGLRQVVGKKAKVDFLNGDTKIGYIGCDFKDDEGDDCVGLFEAYDNYDKYEYYKGFFDYHLYKLKDILRMDVQYFRDDSINFIFDIKIRDINKVVKGATEKRKK